MSLFLFKLTNFFSSKKIPCKLSKLAYFDNVVKTLFKYDPREYLGDIILQNQLQIALQILIVHFFT